HMCDLQCIHIFTFTLMAHCTSGAIRGFSVLLKDASTGNRTSNLLITKRLLYLLYHCRQLTFPRIPEPAAGPVCGPLVPTCCTCSTHPSPDHEYLPFCLPVHTHNRHKAL